MIDDESVERNNIEPKPFIITNDSAVSQHAKPNIEIPLRGSQRIRRPTLSDYYVYLQRSKLSMN